MTRDHDYAGARVAVAATTPRGDATRAFSVRELVTYRRLIVQRERIDPERVVAEYAASHPGVDLDRRSTFGDWQASPLSDDTAPRLRGLPIP